MAELLAVSISARRLTLSAAFGIIFSKAGTRPDKESTKSRDSIAKACYTENTAEGCDRYERLDRGISGFH